MSVKVLAVKVSVGVSAKMMAAGVVVAAKVLAVKVSAKVSAKMMAAGVMVSAKVLVLKVPAKVPAKMMAAGMAAAQVLAAKASFLPVEGAAFLMVKHHGGSPFEQLPVGFFQSRRSYVLFLETSPRVTTFYLLQPCLRSEDRGIRCRRAARSHGRKQRPFLVFKCFCIS
jgi:hypothetical protein